jgi:hypothetical protein
LEKFFFLVLMGIGFTLIFGLVAPSIYASWRTRDKVTANAKLLDVRSVAHMAGRKSYSETLVRYQYQFEGEWFEGNRIAIARSTARFYNELKQAGDQNRTIRVYIDPKIPSYSVYDRELFTWHFGMGLIIGAGFSAIGLHGLLWLIRHKPKGRKPVSDFRRPANTRF